MLWKEPVRLVVNLVIFLSHNTIVFLQNTWILMLKLIGNILVFPSAALLISTVLEKAERLNKTGETQCVFSRIFKGEVFKVNLMQVSDVTFLWPQSIRDCWLYCVPPAVPWRPQWQRHQLGVIISLLSETLAALRSPASFTHISGALSRHHASWSYCCCHASSTTRMHGLVSEGVCVCVCEGRWECKLVYIWAKSLTEIKK